MGFQDGDGAPASAPSGGWLRWLRVWTAVAAGGTCLALLAWSLVTVVWTAGVAASCAVVIYLLSQTPTAQPHQPQHSGQPEPLEQADPLHPAAAGLSRFSLLTAGRVGLLAGLGAVAAGVLGGISVLLLLSVLACALVTTPPVTRSFPRPTAPPTQEQLPAGDRPVVVDLYPLPPAADAPWTLTNAELCVAWRRSFVALKFAESSAQKARVVAIRQAYLDEMEARSGEALRAWLESGARAAGGPERFLLTGEGNDDPHAA